MNLDVVVVTYQSVDTIADCLSALPAAADVTVIDNASTDGTADVIASLGVDVVRNATNDGFAAAANLGARRGDGDLILFLNPDAIVDRTNLDRMVLALEADATLAVVGPQLVEPNGDAQRSAWPMPSPAHTWAEALGYHRFFQDRPTQQFVVGACFLIRRVAFEAVGGFDERYWLYGEEADLCARLVDAGWRCEVVPSAFATHIGGASGGDNPGLVAEHFQRGTERFIQQRWGRIGLVAHRAGLFVGSLLRLLILTVVPGRAKTRADRRAIVKRLVRLRTKPLREPPPTHSRGTDLVVCSLEAWDDVWRRNQFLVRELLQLDHRRRVLFVEPPVDRLHALSKRRFVRAPRPRRSPTDPRITLVTPTKFLPRILDPGADRRLASQVRRAAAKAGFQSPTLWINDSVFVEMLSQTQWPSVYDITDDWLLSSGTRRERRRRERREARMLAAADEVVVCSPELQRSRERSRLVSLIPNAVDVERFQVPLPRPTDLPLGKVALYVGTLHEDRLDINLIEALHDGVVEAEILLVGPNALSQKSIDRLDGLPRVRVLGSRPYEDIPAYYQHADVLIVPHVVTPFTESLDPIKKYECLASNRPTVATPVAGFVGEGEPIRIASGDDFVAAVADAMVARRPAPAPEHLASWRDRAVDFAAVLERASQGRRERRLRVLYLDHCAQMSGGEIALLRLIEASEAVEAIVLLAEDGPLAEVLRARGVHVEIQPLAERSRNLGRTKIGRRLPVTAAWDSARYVFVIARRIRQLGPDLVHTNSLKAGVYGSLAARLARTPVVWHVRDRIADDYMPGATARLVRSMIRVLPTAVVANSQATRATLGAANAVVIHDGAPTTTRKPRRESAQVVIGLVGRIAPWKGQDVFLRALAEVRKQTEFTALIVGSAMFGEEAFEREARALSTSLGLDDCVRFTGFIKDMSEIWSELDVVVHASTVPEPFGQVVVEAMAAGLPVVAADAGGPTEVIADGVDGLLYEMGNAEAMGNAIARLVLDQGLCVSLAAGATKRAEDFTTSRTAEQMLQVYRSVSRIARS